MSIINFSKLSRTNVSSGDAEDKSETKFSFGKSFRVHQSFPYKVRNQKVSNKKIPGNFNVKNLIRF